MAKPNQRTVPFQVTLRTDHPHLLEGLNHWIELGLISETQALRFCAIHLCCHLPETLDESVEQLSTALSSAPATPVVPRPLPEPIQVFQRFTDSLKTELSVIWLLFLGVFIIVISSGIMAASQWRNVSPVGQYGILLTYTLAFWGVSEWTKRQERLQLTASMLQLTTLLIVPVNFWMIDGLKLTQTATGLGLAVIAAIGLSGVVFRLLTQAPTRAIGLTGMGAIALNFLQFGWQSSHGTIPHWPLLAIYLGICSTAFITFRNIQFPPPEASPETTAQGWLRGLMLSQTTLFYSAVLLLFRGWLVQQVALSQLGLAFGLCGWIAIWLSRKNPSPSLWIGFGFLLFGWSIALPATPPWQGIIISGLALWVLWDQLRQRWQPWTVYFILAVGFQLLWLIGRSLPQSFSHTILTTVSQWFGAAGMPYALNAIAFFPYLWVMVAFSRQLKRWNQPGLAQQTNWSALALGGVLFLCTLENGALRSLYLGVSCLTLIALKNPRLVGLAQFTGIGAMLSSVHTVFPALSLENWFRILVAGTSVEWIASWLSPSLPWKRSAWYSGLVLGFIGSSLYFTLSVLDKLTMSWIILVLPGLLVFLSNQPQFFAQQQAYWLSLIGITVIQVDDTLSSFVPRLISFGAGLSLMAIQTARHQKLMPALLTIGSTLGLSFTLSWHWYTGDRWDLGVTFAAIASLVLVTLRHGLQLQFIPGHPIYKRALDSWLGIITLLNGTFLSIYGGLLWTKQPTPINHPTAMIIAASITLLALVYRWLQRPHDVVLWLGSGWLNLLVVLGLGVYYPQPEVLAIAQLSLAIFAQLLGEVWVRRTGQSYQPSWHASWHAIPLCYAGLGLLIGHTQFTATTGVLTIATALICLMLSRRSPVLQPLTYIGLAGLSIGAYERLIYALAHAKGGEAADGILLLAGLGALLAWIYQLLSDRLASFFRLPASSTSLIGALHWMFGSLFMLVTLGQLASDRGEWMGIGILLLLGSNALWRGKQLPIWIYAGSLQCFVALTDLLQQFIPSTTFNAWGGAIVSLLAIAFYRIPWYRWGWETTPWLRMICLWPGLVIGLTAFQINIQSLLIAGTAYATIALQSQRFRISYISVALGLWAGWRILDQYNVRELLWYVVLLGVGLLYGAQFDPQLRSPEARQTRHLLRCLATGLISLTALYQSDHQFVLGLATLAIGLIFMLAGIGLKVRAFLYLGTVTIVLKMLRLTWLFVAQEPQALWAVGIVIGLLLTFIAANFEARRTQVSQMTEFWSTELRSWE